jgi:hypothetical protein
MNTWVEVNLPWRVPLPSVPQLEAPDLEDEIRSIFGETENDLIEKLFPSSGPYFTEHPSWVSFRQVEDDLEREVAKQCSHMSGDERRQETLNRLAQSTDPGVMAVLEYRARRNAICSWYDIQPSVVIWREELQARYDAAGRLHKTMCFSVMDEAVAGTLMEVEREGKIHQMLIGHINALGGVCDDCRGIEDDDLIKRYRIVWRDNNEQGKAT